MSAVTTLVPGAGGISRPGISRPGGTFLPLVLPWGVGVHIYDGFLSTPVWAAMDVAAAPAVGYMVRRAQREFDESRIPLLGVMGAFVFAAQMINFTVGIGTSGHLVGGALLACTLGPAAAGVGHAGRGGGARRRLRRARGAARV